MRRPDESSIQRPCDMLLSARSSRVARVAAFCCAAITSVKFAFSRFAEPTLQIVADERLLDSALSNLVRNAVKFSAPGATVHLRAKQSVERVVLEVEDQCGGLPEGAVEKMFSPFVQLGQDRSGFGLGLAISKRAAELHKGDLRVHDVPGHGCVFVLDLPLEPSLLESPEEAPTKNDP